MSDFIGTSIRVFLYVTVFLQRLSCIKSVRGMSFHLWYMACGRSPFAHSFSVVFAKKTEILSKDSCFALLLKCARETISGAPLA